MKSNYRLTVHLTEVKPVRQSTGTRVKDSKGKMMDETKVKLFNTLSFYCKTKEACIQKLSEVRTKYKIAKGKDYRKKDKYDKELYNISFVN